MNSKRPPILLSGLILGLFGLANLLLNYHSIFFHFLNGLALILWLYLTLALVLSFSDYRQDLQKAPFLSSFATYPMASMLLAAYLNKLGLLWMSQLLWYLALLLLLSQAFYLLVLCLLPRIFRLGPQLSWSALTFPLVNTAFALKLGLDYLGWTWLVWLSHAEALLAVVIVLYVCFYYTVSLRARKITKNPR